LFELHYSVHVKIVIANRSNDTASARIVIN